MNNTCHCVPSYHPALRSTRVQSRSHKNSSPTTGHIWRHSKNCIHIDNFWKSTTTSALNSSNNRNVRKSRSQSIHKFPNWHFYSPLLGMMQQQRGNRVLLMKTSPAWRFFQAHLTLTQMHNYSSAGSEEPRNQTTTPRGSSTGRNERQSPCDFEQHDKKHWESMQLVEIMYVVFIKTPEMAVIHMRTVFLIKEPAARNPI